MSHIATDPRRHMFKTAGDGHCVALVREATGLGPTSTWRRGTAVRGGGHAGGTAIATFGASGLYENRLDGSSHAAILLAEYSDGLLVLDQWLNHPPQERVIRFRGGQGNAVNDADQFYVIETA